MGQKVISSIEQVYMRPRSENSLLNWLIWLGLFLFLVTLTVLSFFLYHLAYPVKEANVAFEIEFANQASEVFSKAQGKWLALKRGDIVNAHDKLRTREGEISFKVPDKIHFRLKNNSEVMLGAAFQKKNEPVAQVHLIGGTLLGTTEHNLKNDDYAQIQTREFDVHVQKASFQIGYQPDSDQAAVRVLGGRLHVQSKFTKTSKPVVISSLQKVEFQKGQMSQLAPVSIDEWNQMKEAYELIAKTTASEVKQMDLSKQAGNFFQHIFDHGAFYSPKIGFSEREFIKDDSGNVYLEVSYDVFPRDALVGVYLKVRDLDLSQFEVLEFEARRAFEEHFPDTFQVELKSRGVTVRSFVEKDIVSNWKKVVLPLRTGVSIAASEMTFVFTHEAVGPNKRGSIQFRNFNLKPLAKMVKAKKEIQPPVSKSSAETAPHP